MNAKPNLSRLREFVRAFTLLVNGGPGEEIIFVEGRALLARLVAHDDWLPAEYAEPDPLRYRQYLLHCDPLERFSVVSFVWGPGQATPIHDHTVWGIVGVLRGCEQCEEFAPPAGTGPLAPAGSHVLAVGATDLVSPRVGDIHRVSNALEGGVSVSVHVYGANIGATSRHVYDPVTGEQRHFVSGYANAHLPNPWSVTPD
jgi:predicted metal-dependent enzyme (double-stranded beta helix superfamily)